ncbi:hypothetical protein G7Y79_00002g005690 [Physcia stellaris]|nr:hypothetical protein G7Y79_00002g005690 [Physcia stellaris]
MSSTLSLQDFDLGEDRGVIDSFNMLGMGHNSTLLDSLLANKAVNPSIYFYWEGWSGAEAQACIDEGFAISSVAGYIWESFVEATGVIEIGPSNGRSTKINFWGILIEATAGYEGDLTLSISPGLNIVIPNHQLKVPNCSYSPLGENIQSNSSTIREVLLSLSGVNTNGMPRLSRSFLTSAHLLVDQDNLVFTFAKVKATTDQILVEIAPSTCEEAEVASTSGSTTSNTANAPTEATTHQDDHKGVIAVAVVGGTIAFG